MRTLLMSAATLFLSSSLYAQESPLYLLFEYMKVEEGKAEAYLQTEEFWAGIHKQRALAGETVGWDLWALQPSGSEQGYQYLTVNLFDSLEAMLKGTTVAALLAHAKKAYPNLSEEEVEAKFYATSDSRDLAVRVYLSRVDATTGGTEMKEGFVALITSMKAKDPAYEKAESEIFKPIHQQMVDGGAKASWGLLRVLLPLGSDRYASHVVVNMYSDLAQYVKANDYEGPESNLLTDLAVQKGLETRDLKKVTFATLLKMVRR